MFKPHYSLMDQLMASPTAPLPAAVITPHLSAMYQGLRALERDEKPTVGDWRIVSDAVNLLETLVTQGHVRDDGELLRDVMQAMADAGVRHLKKGLPLRLSGAGLQAVRAMLEDYAVVVAQLSAREMICCHRATELRISRMRRRQRMSHDVVVVEL